MKSFFSLCICFILSTCTPTIHRNSSFFKTHNLDARLHNALVDTQIGDTLFVSGMASTMQIAGDAYPVIYFISANNQFSFVPVENLPAIEAAKVQLIGIVQQNAEFDFPVISPIQIKKMSSFQPFIFQARQYTEKLKLNLPAQKNAKWIAFEYEKLVIVFMQSADVMYAYHADFIFDQENLADIYIEKRFKGE